MIRLRVLKSARDVFSVVGYEMASMEMIADAAHSTRTTVYRLFNSKEALFVAAISHALDQARQHMPVLLNDERDPRLVLGDIARAALVDYRESRLDALWRAAMSVKRTSPGLFDEVHSKLGPTKLTTMLTDYFRTATRRGMLRVANPEIAAQQFMALIGPSIELLDQRERPYDEEQWVSVTVDMFSVYYAT